jgi:hypothetical protein
MQRFDYCSFCGSGIRTLAACGKGSIMTGAAIAARLFISAAVFFAHAYVVIGQELSCHLGEDELHMRTVTLRHRDDALFLWRWRRGDPENNNQTLCICI